MKTTGILVKVRGDGTAFAGAAAKSFGVSASNVETILTLPPDPNAALGLAQTGATWLRIGGPDDADEAWSRAHAMVAARGKLGVAGADDIVTAEPDFEQVWETGIRQPPGGPAIAAAAAPACTFNNQDGSGGKAVGPSVGWSTGSAFSELADAAAEVAAAKQKAIVIAHLDTGFDPDHRSKPANLALDRQRSFVAGENPDVAIDVTQPGILKNPGHGPGTIGILAGGKINRPEWAGYTVAIGGAPFATIVPVRIANGVVHFTTSSMAKGFNYATSIGAHVLTMSMGGLTSDLLVDAVNLAYDSGVFLVAAAGNNYADTPMPNSIVFPARYRRVLAACGVMADGRPYWNLNPLTMQGNHGPASKMDTALGAYTPNIAWPERGCADNVDMDGSGTSSATPQVAAAAALWLAKYWSALQGYPPWARVEAAREALFRSAGKSTAHMNASVTKEFIGKGVMQALAALDEQPQALANLKKLPPAKPSWPWLDLLTDGGVSFGPRSNAQDRQIPMLKLELTQMAQRFVRIDGCIPDPDLPAEAIPVYERLRYLERALDEGNPSKPLRQFLETFLGKKGGPGAQTEEKPIKRGVRLPTPPMRRLRIYSLDPSIAQSNDFFTVIETTLSLPWDDVREHTKPDSAGEQALKPGPVGEYLEVVDVDPASNKVYDPVDLNDKVLLAQDGLAPSEGNPQVPPADGLCGRHADDRHFRAGARAQGPVGTVLGCRPRRRQVPVRRLRIYPHALRARERLLQPEQAWRFCSAISSRRRRRPGCVAPGSMVFTCLSSDIISHEMSHALLDGLHRRFTEASNPDVPAFHEAFADIVAIFQHFTFRDLVRFEISRARGKMTAATLLGGLAHAIRPGQRQKPARCATIPTRAEGEHAYETTDEAHDRGSILVFAVYDAFLKIVARRTADLIRLATGGTGILRPGCTPPGSGGAADRRDLQGRQAHPQHLHPRARLLPGRWTSPSANIYAASSRPTSMPCRRTPGAIAWPSSKRSATGASCRATSRRSREETLTWNTYFDENDSGWIEDAVRSLNLDWNLDLDRDRVLEVNEKNRWTFWNALNAAFKKNPELARQFGLKLGIPRYNHKGEIVGSSNRNPATTFEVYGVRPTRRVMSDGSFRTELVAVIHQRQPIWRDEKDKSRGWFWFRGGATLIIDPRPGHVAVRYSIVKNSTSLSRQERQRQYGRDMGLSPLRSLYFDGEEAEPFAMMHSKMGGY